MNFTKAFQLTSRLGAALLFTMTLACGDDGAEGGEGTEGSAGSETAGESDSAETGTASMTGDGDGDPTGDGDGDPATGDGDGDPETGDGDGDPETGDGDGDPTDTDTDTDTDTMGESPCFDIEEQGACDDDPECQSVIGAPLKQNGPDAPCLEPQEFLGCIPQQGCDDAETWFCVGGNNKPFLVPDTCGPQDGEMCDPPAEDPPACP